MKKLFATFVMLIVTLAGWATITPQYVGTTLTLTYVDTGDPNELNNFNNNYTGATTIVLKGDWANKDLTAVGKIVGNCQNNVFLDLSACSQMISKVDTSTGIDWTSDNLTFIYNGNRFSLDGGDFNNAASKLSGIAFPNHENFTAIPDQVFGQNALPNITKVTLGNNLLYIGKKAFYGTKLTSFTFPSSLKVIGPQAFEGVTTLTSVDLQNCKSLVKIGYEAFEECSGVTSVSFPSGDALTYIGNDAFNKCSSISSIDMSMCKGVKKFQSQYNNGTTYKTFNNCSALKSFIFPPNLTEVPKDDDGVTGLFKNSNALEYIEFTGKGEYVNCVLQNPLTIGKMAFGEAKTKLATVKLSNNVSFIGMFAFKQTAIESIHIPASVEKIEAHAFYKCANLKIVYFDEFDKSCGDCEGAKTELAGNEGSGGQGGGAFEECQSITDIYINTKAELNCLNNAFDQDISWGAGDPGSDFATLHFPKEKIEHYVNLSHYLTDEIVNNSGLFHKWLMAHYKQAVEPHKNGWYEFINAGPMDPPGGPVYQDIILRTFSDHDYSYLVPDGLRAYVVTKVEKVEKNYQLTVQRIRVIPAGTGVILYGHPNGKNQEGKPALVLTPVAFAPEAGMEIALDGGTTVTSEANEGLPLCRANWSENYVKNYLEPTSDEDGNAMRIEPFDWDKNKTGVAWRNFAMNRYNTTRSLHTVRALDLEAGEHDYVGFFRILPKTHPVGYAYLRLTGDVDDNGVARATTDIEYTDAEGLEVVVIEDPDFYMEYNMKDNKMYNPRETANPNGWWDLDHAPKFDWTEWTLSWGIRPSRFVTEPATAPIFLGEMEDADGIVKIVAPTDNQDGEYYTLQGVRVAHPTKGVYIQNGKKVIIK